MAVTNGNCPFWRPASRGMEDGCANNVPYTFDYTTRVNGREELTIFFCCGQSNVEANGRFHQRILSEDRYLHDHILITNREFRNS